MSIKYFEYIFLILLGMIAVLPVIFIRWHLRLNYLRKLTRINILRRQQTNDNIVLYSTVVLNECCRILYFSHSKMAKRALRFLAIGKVEPAVDYLFSVHPLLGQLLFAHQDAVVAKSKIFKKRRTFPATKYAVFLPILAHLCHDVKDFLSAIAKLKSAYTKDIRPYYDYIISYAYLLEGDMLSASQAASRAQKTFKNRKFIFEEAECCLALAEIYRVSCVEDIAQTMLESALKTYHDNRLSLLSAKATAMLGMLMLFENRREEAEEKYYQALNIAPTKRIKADIYNQLTLLYIAENKLKIAEKNAKIADKLNQELLNRHGIALGYQLRAHIKFGQLHYTAAEKYLKQSLEIYEQDNNFSAVAECLYLTAESNYKMKSYRRAEKKLRLLLDICRQHPNNFHIANAYSLLGLIYLKTGDKQRAKVLFQQSLRLEQNHERCEGLVADYANLALIEQISGDTASALRNLQTAAEYARQSGDENLQKIIDDKLKSMS